MDLFLSFETSIGPTHRDKEDVFILGLYGKTMYRVWKNNTVTEVLINRGDMIYIPSGVLHRSISITPRIIASLSLWGKSND
jgi:cupin superfamily acireductone dioxygenase involved in methionine salvage